MKSYKCMNAHKRPPHEHRDSEESHTKKKNWLIVCLASVSDTSEGFSFWQLVRISAKLSKNE